MVQVPLRGLFLLGRAAFIVAAAAAVPYIIKKNRRLGEQLGDALIKAGENLKKDVPSPKGTAPKTSQTVKTSAKSATATAATPKAKAKAAPKRKAAKKRTAKKKPAAASPPAE